ncbi:MAG: SinI family restriction endonuclease [Moraxellaceae bacterium]|jgi:hypothetical protein|nr:SinI family restriction endonuclease [Moraxellaceae bacterium]MBP8851850.1 SinI family restriction endonuclease [Moraxellaceae bacterium]MBP9045306.1 SinI family restriction endonuclease [Moraxellaceae bacterium]MBP9730637.1 SinI family restriction endonuclease [Moraxellaceae bacterium]
MSFNQVQAQEIAMSYCEGLPTEQGLASAFVGVCLFLSENPERLSWRGNVPPDLATKDGLEKLAKKYFAGYRRSDFPAQPGTIPDQMVSIVLQVAYGYSTQDSERIKVEHQQSMCAENCVGALLERYLDSVLRQHGWYWCCGEFVKAVDFIKRNANGSWVTLQVKNRDNTENSSSSAIRSGTQIQKWFRSFSKTGKTNWENVPSVMKNIGLSEEGFISFTKLYLDSQRKIVI